MKNGRLLLALILVFGFINSHSQVCNIYFDFNSDVMRINDVSKLEQLIEAYGKQDQVFMLVGHTDTVGNADYNLQLSERRVNSIQSYLISKQIDPKRIKSDFKGEKVHISQNQFYNRRVEVFLLNADNEIGTVDDFVELLKPKPQEFIIPTDKEVVIEGAKGTVLTIPANAFIYADGTSPSDDVRLNLTEYYSLPDFFSDKLSTVSNGEILISGGMVYIHVFKKETDLKLKKGIEIELAFPNSTNTQFQTFYGQRTNTGDMNWIPDKIAKPATVSTEDLGVTFGDDGRSLIITDLATAEERNSKIQYNPLKDRLDILSEAEKKAAQKYYNEQDRIDQNRSDYYSILKSNKLRYINCDRFMRDPETVNVEYTVVIDNTDIDIFAVNFILRSTNGLLAFQKTAKNTYSISGEFPVNRDFELFILGQKDYMPYICNKPLRLTGNETIHVTLKESTFDQVREIF